MINDKLTEKISETASVVMEADTQVTPVNYLYVQIMARDMDRLKTKCEGYLTEQFAGKIIGGRFSLAPGKPMGNYEEIEFGTARVEIAEDGEIWIIIWGNQTWPWKPVRRQVVRCFSEGDPIKVIGRGAMMTN